MNKLIYTFLLFIVTSNCFAQLDLECYGRDLNSIYLVSHINNMIYRIDSVDSNPSNLIPVQSVPNYAIGISINQFLDSTTTDQTMYFVNHLSQFFFWNGIGWSNTGHTSGHISAENIGGSSDFVFALDANLGSCDIYRYDGISNGSHLVNVSGLTIVADIANDSLGNFYLFHLADNKIVSYSFSGLPIDSFVVTGSTTGLNGGAGFTLLGDKFYFDSTYDLHRGTVTGDTVNFTIIATHTSVYVADIASCPTSGFPVNVKENIDLSNFTIYPNPANDFAIIKLTEANTLKISNQVGDLVNIYSVSGIQNFKLNVKELKAGIYYVTVISKDSHSNTLKLIIY